MKIAIDLTWVKPKITGGLESYIRNLLDGFLELKDKNEYVLLTAKDNDDTFTCYLKDKRVKKVLCDTNALNVKRHLIWQNLKQYKLLKKLGIDFCFFPVYEMPIYKNSKIKSVTVIHDIQAIHFPEFFSYLERLWFKIAWKKVSQNSNMVVTISDYTKKDLENHFKFKENLTRIYNPIVLNDNEKYDFSKASKDYKIKENEYYYTVCSLLKHKNLITLINVIERIVKDKESLPKKLIISGVGGSQKEEFKKLIKEKKLEKNIVLTKFVSNKERNCLIRNCNTFLFPSLFEGFGMPPVEAMMLGSNVITTRCTSLEEVTQNKCLYVNDPLSLEDWIDKIKKSQTTKKRTYKFKEYDKKFIARQYLELFYKVYDKKR